MGAIQSRLSKSHDQQEQHGRMRKNEGSSGGLCKDKGKSPTPKSSKRYTFKDLFPNSPNGEVHDLDTKLFAGERATGRVHPPSKSVQKGSCTESADGGPVRRYHMNSRPRGPVLIINNFGGEGPSFSFRQGSCHDVGKLSDTFEKLHFNVKTMANLTAEQMKEECKALAKAQNGDSLQQIDCVVVVILTHGKSFQCLLGVDSKPVSLTDLISSFYGDESPALVGKPKIFIVQACRGLLESKGVPYPGDRESSLASAQSRGKNAPAADVRNSSEMSDKEEAEDPEISQESVNSGILPRNADIVVAFSSCEFEKSYRNTEMGSWYIEELTEVLTQEYSKRSGRKRKRHFTEILTEVQGRVSNLATQEGFVQMPEYRSTLRGPIYFS